MPKRPLGSQGLVVSAQGLGTMGMTAFYSDNPAAHEDESLATIDRALELGINFFDTAWIYQHWPSGATNEALVGKAIAKHGRDKFIIATKFGISVTASGPSFDSSPENIRRQLQDSLTRLGTDYVDLYYQHRADPNTPIEVVVETLKELIQEGKIRFIGLSECTAQELRRAHAVHPITAIQMEWSLQTRDIEAEIVPTARELGVGIVAYSPLGRGLLSQRFTTREELPESDRRRNLPRFSEENFEENKLAAERLAEIAQSKGCTPGQLALAWLHAQGDDVFPIPGTKKPERVEENARAVTVHLSPEEAQQVAAAIPEVKGDRYPNMEGSWNKRV